MVKNIMAAVLTMAQFMATAQSFDVFIGAYTPSGGSEGIYHSQLDQQTGKLTAPELAAKTPNPSFLVIKGDCLYAVAEQKAGMLRAFRIDAQTKKLNFINEVSSGGSYPCHLAVCNDYLAAANYGSGSVVKVKLDSAGGLSAASEIFRHQGKSIHPTRQTAPHAHWVHLNNIDMWSVDLGIDKVTISMGNNFDCFTQEIACKPGSGPRHIAFSADHCFAYIINELDNTIAVVSLPEHNIIQTISTLPEGFKGESACAAIRVHPNGQWLYGSNRGHDSIVRFAIDPEKGTLSAPAFQTREIKWPRDFNLTPDGKFCLVANERGDSVVVFRIDPASGELRETGEKVAVKKPTCIQFH